jgi:hypothetical protein
MYELLTVNTTVNKINNIGICFTWFLLSHVSILVDHHQVIVSIHLNKINIDHWAHSHGSVSVTQAFSNYSILFILIDTIA